VEENDVQAETSMISFVNGKRKLDMPLRPPPEKRAKIDTSQSVSRKAKVEISANSVGSAECSDPEKIAYGYMTVMKKNKGLRAQLENLNAFKARLDQAILTAEILPKTFAETLELSLEQIAKIKAENLRVKAEAEKNLQSSLKEVEDLKQQLTESKYETSQDNTIDEMKQVQVNLRKQIDELKHENSHLEDVISMNESHTEGLKAETRKVKEKMQNIIDGKDDEIRDLEREMQNRSGEMDVVQNKLDKARRKSETMKVEEKAALEQKVEKMAEWSAKVSALEVQRDELIQKMEKMQAANTELSSGMSAISTKLEASEKQLAEGKSELQSVRRDLSEIQNLKVKLETEKAHLQEALDTSDAEVKKMMAVEKRTLVDLGKHHDEIEELKRKCESLQIAKDETESKQRQEIEQFQQNKDQEISQLQEKIEKLHQEVHRLGVDSEKENRDTIQALEHHQVMVRNLTDENERMKAFIESIGDVETLREKVLTLEKEKNHLEEVLSFTEQEVLDLEVSLEAALPIQEAERISTENANLLAETENLKSKIKSFDEHMRNQEVRNGELQSKIQEMKEEMEHSSAEYEKANDSIIKQTTASLKKLHAVENEKLKKRWNTEKKQALRNLQRQLDIEVKQHSKSRQTFQKEKKGFSEKAKASASEMKKLKDEMKTLKKEMRNAEQSLKKQSAQQSGKLKSKMKVLLERVEKKTAEIQKLKTKKKEMSDQMKQERIESKKTEGDLHRSRFQANASNRDLERKLHVFCDKASSYGKCQGQLVAFIAKEVKKKRLDPIRKKAFQDLQKFLKEATKKAASL